MKLLSKFIHAAALLALASLSYGAAISISIDSGNKSIRNEANAVLSGGVVGTAKDGTAVELGYYSDASASNPFGLAGQFIALTGAASPFLQGGTHPEFNFTVGDTPGNGAGNGELFISNPSLVFNSGIADSLLPPTGTPLVMRFYNAGKVRVLDLANPALWTWLPLTTPPSSVSINFDSVGLVMRGTGNTSDSPNTRSATAVPTSTVNLLTTTPVPEPSSILLAVAGAGVILSRRQRR